LLEQALGPDEVEDAVGHFFRAAGQHLGVARLLRGEQPPDGDAGVGARLGYLNLFNTSGLLGLADAGDGGVAGWLPGRLDTDDRRRLQLEARGLAAAELLADDDGVVL